MKTELKSDLLKKLNDAVKAVQDCMEEVDKTVPAEEDCFIRDPLVSAAESIRDSYKQVRESRYIGCPIEYVYGQHLDSIFCSGKTEITARDTRTEKTYIVTAMLDYDDCLITVGICLGVLGRTLKDFEDGLVKITMIKKGK